MIEVRIVRGGMSGTSKTFTTDRVTIGRHPDAELALHPELDLHASAHHASLVRTDRGWSVRDLGSSNGTWVNGEPVDGTTELANGDRIRLGVEGPEVEVRFVSSQAGPERAPRSPTPAVRPSASLVAGLGLATACVLVLVSMGWMRDRARWQAEKRAMEASIDSVLRAGQDSEEALQGRLAGLRYALDQSQREIERLRDDVARASRNPEAPELMDLRAQLQEATQALQRQQLAAALDFGAIESSNRGAIALIYAEGPTGEVTIASGFAVSPEGILATNRHVILGPKGERPTRIGVQFTGSMQVFPATVLALSEEGDLGLLRVEKLVGEVPAVLGLSQGPDTVGVVAMMGFPLAATQASGPNDSRVPEPLVSAGVVVRHTPESLEIQGYGAQGSSGSPVFDGRGSVIGVVYGGRPDRANPTVLAVPVRQLSRLLASVR